MHPLQLGPLHLLAATMADYHTQYKGPEGETTEWEDIHIKLGNMAPKPKPAKAPEYEPDQEKKVDGDLVN